MSITISSRISVIYRTSSLDCIVYTLDLRFGVSMVIPSFMSGVSSHDRRGGLRTPGQRNPPPIKRVLKNTRETHLVGLEPTTSGFGNQRSTN